MSAVNNQFVVREDPVDPSSSGIFVAAGRMVAGGEVSDDMKTASPSRFRM